MTRIPANQVIEAALTEFWADDGLSYKASVRDAIIYAVDALGEQDYELPRGGLVESAANAAFVLGSYGMDDQQVYFDVLAAILTDGTA